jgi:hypothetical protein
MPPFKPNRKFRRDYDRLYRKDPLGANTFLLLCELDDGSGQIKTSTEEIAVFLAARFENPEAYQI